MPCGPVLMTAEELVQLRNQALERLGALQILFRSDRWLKRLATVSAELREAATEVELLVEARFLKMQALPLSHLAARLQANRSALSAASDKVLLALDDTRNVRQVVDAASELASVATRLAAVP